MFQPGNGVLREFLVLGQKLKLRLTVGQGQPVVPAVDHGADPGLLGVQRQEGYLTLLQLTVDDCPTGGEITIQHRVAVDDAQLLVNATQLIQEGWDSLIVASRQINPSSLLTQRSGKGRQPRSALAGAVYGAAGII